MRHFFPLVLIPACFTALFLFCYAPALFFDRQFAFRDSSNYYYPLNQRVQEEWNQGRWPLWEPEENGGMPLLGNPTAAVLYPGKLVFTVLPYAWGARIYIVAHTALAFLGMLVLMRSWETTWFGSAESALAYAFGAPILLQYCNVIYLIGAAWLPWGVHAVDRWVRLRRRSGLLELAIVLSMQVLGGEPEAAYLLGLAGVGYAVGLARSRARSIRGESAGAKARLLPRPWTRAATVAIAIFAWCVLTLVLAQWLPKLRATGKPTPPLFWMPWVPWLVAAAWALGGLGFYGVKRGWRTPLGLTLLGLVASATLAVALTAAQLLPVIEFTQRTSRAADGGAQDVYPYSVEPFRLLEMVWPNMLGTQFDGNKHWGALIPVPGVVFGLWAPSLYLGGLTFVLAASSLSLRHGPAWRVWLTMIVVVSLVGSLGRYGSPIWAARVLAVHSRSAILDRLLADLGPVDPIGNALIRDDGYLRDSDGGFYWCLMQLLPGFRQFRYPAKLFTFTALGLAALAGAGWDRVLTGRGRGAAALFGALLVLSLAALGGAAWEREPVLGSLRALKSQSVMGPFDAEGAYQAMIRSLEQAAIVFGLGLVLTTVARKRPRLACAVALVVMTGDLAAANARYILTVPQSVFETKPEVLKIIEDAERDHPSPGPYRVQCVPSWGPLGWQAASQDRNNELVIWGRATLQPKYGINLGVEYTHAVGVAELYDHDWYFNPFFRTIRDPLAARLLGVEPGKEVVYYARRGYDLWNTRYFITPYWRDDARGYASFLFGMQRIYPGSDRFRAPDGGQEAEKTWLATENFQVLRNLQEFPRAWVVHDTRATPPFTGHSPTTRRAAMLEMLYAPDPAWNDDTLRAYDARAVAWVGSDDLQEIRGRLSGKATGPSEAVKVTYPNPQQAIVEVTLDSAGLVILADVFYPGWMLLIDGAAAPIYRVNGIMRGALVPAGAHQLVFTYEPRSFRLGLWLSSVGLAALLILGAVSGGPFPLRVTARAVGDADEAYA